MLAHATGSSHRVSAILSAPPQTIFAIATLLALALSTQFFFQPFVWRYWPVDRVLAGWADVAIGNLLMLEPVALGLVLAGWASRATPSWRWLWLGGAIVGGAVAGNLLAQVRAGGSPSLIATLLQSLRVILVFSAVIAMVAIWRSGTAAAADAADLRAWRAGMRAAADLNELEALRRQIEPHFLFNTLATVRQLQHNDDAEAHVMLARLLVYVRQSLAVAGASRVRLADEIALVEAYLAICRSRLGSRLAARIEMPPELRDAAIPPLILITLVENAIKHGLAPSPTGGTVAVAARRQAATLELLVSDDGVGLGHPGSGDGIGLANTLRRLRLSFGEKTDLSLAANDSRGTVALVRLPLERIA